MCNSKSRQNPQEILMYTCEYLLEEGRVFSSIERLVEAHYGPLICSLLTVKVELTPSRPEDELKFEQEIEEKWLSE